MDEENIPGVAQVGLVKVNLYAEEKAQLKADIENLQAERDDYRNVLERINATVNQPNPGDLKQWMVASGKAHAFAYAIETAREALKRWERK